MRGSVDRFGSGLFSFGGESNFCVGAFGSTVVFDLVHRCDTWADERISCGYLLLWLSIIIRCRVT